MAPSISIPIPKLRNTTKKYILFIILATALIYITYYFLRCNGSQCSTQPQVQEDYINIYTTALIDKNKSNPQGYDAEMPKKIFIYWHEKNISNLLVKKNIELLKEKVKGRYEVLVFNEENILAEIGPSDKKYLNNKMKQHTSDYVRLMLLYKYGGFWMDASILVKQPEELFEKVCKEYKDTYFDVFLFEYELHRSGLQFHDKTFENWFIGAPKNSIFIRDFLEEYKRALSMSLLRYKKEVLIPEKINLKHLLNPNDDKDVYLTQHAILRKLLKDHPARYSILYSIAEDSMFKLSLDCKWNNECFYQQLLSNANNQDLYGVKIYRHHREHINKKGEDAVNKLLSQFYETGNDDSNTPLTKEVLMDDPDVTKPKPSSLTPK